MSLSVLNTLSRLAAFVQRRKQLQTIRVFLVSADYLHGLEPRRTSARMLQTTVVRFAGSHRNTIKKLVSTLMRILSCSEISLLVILG